MNSATTDLVGVDPLEYLNPFLEVIKSPETSGPITGTALTAIYKFLTRDIIGELQNSWTACPAHDVHAPPETCFFLRSSVITLHSVVMPGVQGRQRLASLMPYRQWRMR